MSESKHTPGPWTGAQSNEHEIIIVGRGPVVSGCIAVVSLAWIHADQRKEQVANAHLIAAAPDLLSALKELRDWYTNFTKLPAAKANAAIAKAEVKYKVKEFRPGLYHVMDGPTPIYDKSSDGNDKPLVFHDADAADECARKMNEENRL